MNQSLNNGTPMNNTALPLDPQHIFLASNINLSINIVQREKSIMTILGHLKSQKQLLEDMMRRRSFLHQQGEDAKADVQMHNMRMQLSHLELMNKESIFEFLEMAINLGE